MKVGDLVEINGNPKYSDYGQVGLVQWVNERYPPQCGVIMNGDTAIYDPRVLKVINESR